MYFQRVCNMQHYVKTLTENWKRIEDNANHLGILLKNLSKTFDYLPHERFIDKLMLMHLAWVLQNCSSHLTNRNQKVRLTKRQLMDINTVWYPQEV